MTSCLKHIPPGVSMWPPVRPCHPQRVTRRHDLPAPSSLPRGLRATLLTMLSGDPHGDPPWVQAISDGEDEGYFGPDSAVWFVNGGNPVMVAGVIALLLQTLHPGAMAGVHDHSRFRVDPLGRLAGTVRWVVTVSFGSTTTVSEELARVSRMHQSVTGSYDASGKTKTYRAADPELIHWVHTVFTYAFLTAHRVYGTPIPVGSFPSGEDRYVAEWATAGELMGDPSPPRSRAELDQALSDFRPSLLNDQRVLEAQRFILRPPLPRNTRLGYRLLAAGAVAALDPEYRGLLGLRRPWWPAITGTKVLLFLIRTILGESTTQRRARERVERLSKTPPAEGKPQRG